ncbi:MAG: phosphoribosylanthranilate isomerase [Syntrophobacteraceae bacterium]
MESVANSREYDGPQVKVCGLTRADEALACAKLGADAIGLVFYPPSPRFVSEAVAREIALSLPRQIWPVGVFVDEPFGAILKKVETCGLRAVQLHGVESPALVEALCSSGVTVIKTLFLNRSPSMESASSYRTAAFLVEGGAGPLPGGNAATWRWGAARGRVRDVPLILAGGLDPGNVSGAIEEVCPDAVDVSSGVESRPGRKDLEKVHLFMEAIRLSRPNRPSGRIFI